MKSLRYTSIHLSNSYHMRHKLHIRLSVMLVFFLIAGLSGKTFSQTYEEARNLAFNGERAKAQQICRAILSQGFNSDVALLLGRTYAWDGQYDSTRVILNEVPVSYTHLRAHETRHDLVCRL